MNGLFGINYGITAQKRHPMVTIFYLFMVFKACLFLFKEFLFKIGAVNIGHSATVPGHSFHQEIGDQERESFNYHYQPHGCYPLLRYDELTGDMLKT